MKQVVRNCEKLSHKMRNPYFSSSGEAESFTIWVDCVPFSPCPSYICSSRSRRTCFPLRKKTSVATVNTQTPLNMIVACMFCGGLAAGEARRAPCTAKDKQKNREIYIYISANEGRGRCVEGGKGETDLIQRRRTTYLRFEQRRSVFGGATW